MMSEEDARASLPDATSIILRSGLGWAVAILCGVGGLFPVKFFGFPNMLAAQTTIGGFGLVGGLSHSLLIRAAGGRVSSKQGLLLSIIWALSCIGGVTPLFFTMGTPLKMAVLAFYSFAVFGALGGVATAFMMRSLFENTSSRDVIPCAVTWSFSFGIAAIVSESLGEGLQLFLPAWFAWAVAIGAMALIVGGGGGYSIVLFLRPGRHGREALERSRVQSKASPKEKNRLYTLVLVLLCVPFYLNDFSNIYVTDWRLWISIDYTSAKLFHLVVVLWLIRNKKMLPPEFGLTSQPVISFATVFLIGALAGTYITQNGSLILNKFSGYPPLGGMPEIESPLWTWVDLTVGLLAVGIFEELVFRGYLHRFLTRYTRHPLLIIAISAVAFGFIHWSEGLHKVVVTAAVGAVFMVLYLRTRSLPAIMLAHFAVDFIAFAKFIPETIFRFL